MTGLVLPNRIHYNEATISMMASQITSISIVYSTIRSGIDQRKKSKLRVTGLCEGNSPVTGKFPTQRASNTENVSIWWLHHENTHTQINIIVNGDQTGQHKWDTEIMNSFSFEVELRLKNIWLDAGCPGVGMEIQLAVILYLLAWHQHEIHPRILMPYRWVNARKT